MRELTIEITDRCPLNCIHCSTNAGKDEKRHLSLEQVGEYLRRFHDFDTVRLSGGEPFEHPELEAMLRSVKSEGRKSVVLSCGVMQRDGDHPHEISPGTMQTVAPYIDEIVFSMQGFYEVHDQIVTSDRQWTRHLPYWDMMIDSCENAQRAGIEISYHTVLMKSNFSNLQDIARAVSCSKLEITPPGKRYRLHILRLVKQGRGSANPDQSLDEEQIEALSTIAKNLERRYGIDITMTNSFQRNGCDCGSAKAVVTIDGEVIPCSALKYGGQTGKYACRGRL